MFRGISTNYPKNPINSPSWGHACVLQSTNLAHSPSHSSPPQSGSGFVHVRLCSCFPPPQLREQSPTFLYSVKPPWTKMQQIVGFGCLQAENVSRQCMNKTWDSRGSSLSNHFMNCDRKPFKDSSGAMKLLSFLSESRRKVAKIRRCHALRQKPT